MENGNKYSVAAQKAFETVMMGAGINRIGGNELVEIFDAASRNAVEGERTAGDPVDTRATGA